MQRYIEQLIDDLRQAAEQAPPDIIDDPEIDDEEALEMELEEAERIVTGPFEKMSDILGIPKKMLPGPNRLNDEHVSLLVPEIEKLLNAYNFYPDYPEKVPYNLLYKALYDIWDDDFVKVNSGQYHIEFCDYDEDNCPFPGYCDYCSETFSDEEKVPENEFNIKANDLKGDDKNIQQDFHQIEKEYYMDDEITDEEGFIPGIHNYCDRWCERCDFTDYCRVFAMEKEMREMLERNKDARKQQQQDEDWTEPEDNTPGVEAEKPEIEMEFPEDLDEELLNERDDFFSSDQKAGRHPMAELAYDYSMSTLKWFHKRNRELDRRFTAQIAHGNVDEIMNADEIMQWYQMLIYTKLKRALTGYYEMEDFEDAGFDMNGSAKVALIGLDRSIDAATILMRHIKAEREQLKKFRDQLEKIRNMAEETFPNAREFIRPGLDEF